MSRVSIVGAGFAALTAIRSLRAAEPGIEIDLIAPEARFVYYPGTIWIPTGKRQTEDLIVPLEAFLDRMRVRHHPARATGLSEDGRRLQTDRGEIENDALIIASGGGFLDKLPGLEHSTLPCGGPEAIARYRDRLLALDGGRLAFGFAGNPAEPAAMRGGPVFEFLFGIDQWLRRNGRRDRFELSFFSPAERPGQRLGPKAVERLLKEMQRRGIQTHLGQKPKRISESGIEIGEDFIESDLTMFMPGMTGNPWFDATALPRSPGGLIQAGEDCRVPGVERVFVAGDAGSFPGPDWTPKQAHMADLQAECAARNLLEALAGRDTRHRFETELMCIIDMYDRGALVTRSRKRGLALPAMRPLHWAKRAFERRYLAQYRK
ncbi:NAD(P)/FAD-dependent oxidoreductase [Wenzhouxiangella marina]|uniref:FAD-dependent pyridine nucleotide-disulfide oxidoreductase n=1 Tax=Wenzhouxiangella marina TaxID=1579979 RepID=A0A0K0XVC3_9GAMM|nr:FAD-dependent oxidoreductase [Wenzhouxiangella marina]AKS41659.1 FAD-dependent pyridine nucleotide-disulfide oxidoreductase [Wenzhouxiangella marina]MBB6086580.1 sulfide:quinone oxidoreductase [Wenzhouxiangella marina]